MAREVERRRLRTSAGGLAECPSAPPEVLVALVILVLGAERATLGSARAPESPLPSAATANARVRPGALPLGVPREGGAQGLGAPAIIAQGRREALALRRLAPRETPGQPFREPSSPLQLARMPTAFPRVPELPNAGPLPAGGRRGALRRIITPTREALLGEAALVRAALLMAPTAPTSAATLQAEEERRLRPKWGPLTVILPPQTAPSSARLMASP